MSVQPPAGVPLTPAPLPPGSVPCARCGEILSPAQDWCLNCGDPARTVIAPTPRWRWPLALLAAVAALALGVLAAAFVGLSNDDPPPAVTHTQTVTTQPAATTAPASGTAGKQATTTAKADTTTAATTTGATTTSGTPNATTNGTTTNGGTSAPVEP